MPPSNVQSKAVTIAGYATRCHLIWDVVGVKGLACALNYINAWYEHIVYIKETITSFMYNGIIIYRKKVNKRLFTGRFMVEISRTIHGKEW